MFLCKDLIIPSGQKILPLDITGKTPSSHSVFAQISASQRIKPQSSAKLLTLQALALLFPFTLLPKWYHVLILYTIE